MNENVRNDAKKALPTASLPGLTDDAEDQRVMVEQLKLVIRRAVARGRDATVLDAHLLRARQIVHQATAELRAVAKEAARVAAHAPATGGEA